MPLLTVRNVTKRFAGLVAVKHVTMEIKEGEIFGLIGPNGAGKTTLFNSVSGFYTPEEGTIEFDGHNITGLSPHTICQEGLARTFQIVKPFGNLSALENVMVGAFNRAKSYTQSARLSLEKLEFVGLADKKDVRVKELTIGDQRRLELARALATQPKLLLLDEVMAGLTPSEVSEVMGLIKKTRESGVTIFIIEHIMQALMNLSDRVFVMHHGEKLAEGTPQEVSSDPKVIEAYLGEVTMIAQA
ncbi:ABC transporter [Clostridiales bacterium PH28_bin88]|nr:ABC transporter [Clostridiales bacterium PH28_bin88]